MSDLTEIKRLASLIGNVGGLQNATNDDPEHGPEFKKKARETLYLCADLMTVSDEADRKKLIHAIGQKLYEVNELVVRVAVSHIAKLGAEMIKLDPKELFRLEKGGFFEAHSEEGYALAEAKLIEPLNELASKFVLMVGNDKFVEYQKDALMELPEELRSGITGFTVSFTAALTSVLRERLTGEETVNWTINSVIGSAMLTRDLLTLPTLISGMSVEAAVEASLAAQKASILKVVKAGREQLAAAGLSDTKPAADKPTFAAHQTLQ